MSTEIVTESATGNCKKNMVIQITQKI